MRQKSVIFGERSGFLDSMHLPNVSEGLIIEIRVQKRSKNYFEKIPGLAKVRKVQKCA